MQFFLSTAFFPKQTKWHLRRFLSFSSPRKIPSYERVVFYELQLYSFQWLRIVRYVVILCCYTLILALAKTIRRLWGSNMHLTTEKVWLLAKTIKRKDICRCFFFTIYVIYRVDYKAFHSIFFLPSIGALFWLYVHVCDIRCTFSGLTKHLFLRVCVWMSQSDRYTVSVFTLLLHWFVFLSTCLCHGCYADQQHLRFPYDIAITIMCCSH